MSSDLYVQKIVLILGHVDLYGFYPTSIFYSRLHGPKNWLELNYHPQFHVTRGLSLIFLGPLMYRQFRYVHSSSSFRPYQTRSYFKVLHVFITYINGWVNSHKMHLSHQDVFHIKQRIAESYGFYEKTEKSCLPQVIEILHSI